MIGKKALLGQLLGTSGMAAGLLRAGGARRDELPILAYHRVVDMGDEAAYPRDPELVSATVADFEQQMRFVREHFNVVKLADVIEHIEHGRALPPRSLALTFDDGHLDNYTHAYPVLRRLGLSACIFLSTDYIGTRRMFWFDRVALLLYFAPAGKWQFGDVSVQLPAQGVNERREAAGAVLRRLKQVPDAQRLACLDAMEQALAAHVPPQAVPERCALNWDEVREMARNGIEFGSHTCSHPILTRLDDAALERELAASAETIAHETGTPAPTICYPIGKVGAFDDRVIQASRRCGYRLGISYEPGLNRLRRLQPFALRRLAVERYTALPFFKGMLALPSLLA